MNQEVLDTFKTSFQNITNIEEFRQLSEILSFKDNDGVRIYNLNLNIDSIFDSAILIDDTYKKYETHLQNKEIIKLYTTHYINNLNNTANAYSLAFMIEKTGGLTHEMSDKLFKTEINDTTTIDLVFEYLFIMVANKSSQFLLLLWLINNDKLTLKHIINSTVYVSVFEKGEILCLLSMTGKHIKPYIELCNISELEDALYTIEQFKVKMTYNTDFGYVELNPKHIKLGEIIIVNEIKKRNNKQ